MSLNRIAETTSFGGNKLLNGTYGSQSFQIGAGSGEAVMLTMGNLRSDNEGMEAKLMLLRQDKLRIGGSLKAQPTLHSTILMYMVKRRR